MKEDDRLECDVTLADAAQPGGAADADGPTTLRNAASSVVPEATLQIDSTSDSRVTELNLLGKGDGFGSYSGRFEGKPTFFIACSTQVFVDEEEVADTAVKVYVFRTDSERDRYIDDVRRGASGGIGQTVQSGNSVG